MATLDASPIPNTRITSGVIARPPERQPKHGAGRGADEKADDGRTEGEADIGESVAVGEECDQRLPNRAWLRPEEAVDPAAIGRDLPQRDDDDQTADLGGDERPGRPIFLHREAADFSRGPQGQRW